MKRLLKILMILALIIVLVVVGGVVYLKSAFPKDGPVVEVSLPKNDTATLARGKYLVNALCGCVECHSPRNLDLFDIPQKEDSLGKGGLLFSEDFGFPGKIYSKNITPTGIGKWTDAQLYHAVTTGVNTDGDVLFPVMPFQHFGKADPEDIKAMLAYIRTLKPLEGSFPKHDLKVPVNLLVSMEAAPAQPVKRPSPSDTLAYGTYLFNLGACNECHTQRDDKGKFIESLTMAGGYAFKFRGIGTVRSSNLTPDVETGLGNWTKDHFIDAFKYYEKPENRNVPWKKVGYQTLMPWLGHSQLTRDDLAALYKYLRSIKPIKNTVVKWTPWAEETASK